LKTSNRCPSLLPENPAARLHRACRKLSRQTAARDRINAVPLSLDRHCFQRSLNLRWAPLHLTAWRGNAGQPQRRGTRTRRSRLSVGAGLGPNGNLPLLPTRPAPAACPTHHTVEPSLLSRVVIAAAPPIRSRVLATHNGDWPGESAPGLLLPLCP
jgi:hypothetical protein